MKEEFNIITLRKKMDRRGVKCQKRGGFGASFRRITLFFGVAPLISTGHATPMTVDLKSVPFSDHIVTSRSKFPRDLF